MDSVAKVSLREKFVRFLEKACDYLDAAPAWFKEDGKTTGLATHYCSLGDVWNHPLASWSQSLDRKWHTGVWQVKEAA